MKRVHLIIAALLVASAASACALDRFVSPCPLGQVCVDGTAQYFNFEGGFWAVRGDDSVTYDPVGSLPASFREAGLRVHLQARVRQDLGSFHMAGPIVDIVAIRKLK